MLSAVNPQHPELITSYAFAFFKGMIMLPSLQLGAQTHRIRVPSVLVDKNETMDAASNLLEKGKKQR